MLHIDLRSRLSHSVRCAVVFTSSGGSASQGSTGGSESSSSGDAVSGSTGFTGTDFGAAPTTKPFLASLALVLTVAATMISTLKL